MMKLVSIFTTGLLFLQAPAFAINDINPWLNSNSDVTPPSSQAYSTSSGLDITSSTAAAIAQYVSEDTNSDYWPNAAVAIAVSAGLQYTVDSQFEPVSDIKVAPYFTGSETGISVSFSFQ